MPKTVKLKDTNGVIQTIAFDPSYPIEVTTLVDTNWTLKTTDPLGTESLDWLGRKPKK